jgi:peptidoglycan/LPS O-acetylase OafA/YrhL
MKARFLTVVMLLAGILLVIGSMINTFASSIFPAEQYLGTDASAAAAAFGAGIAIASFDPVRNVSWVRALILYAILLVVYQIVFGIFVGTPYKLAPLVLGIVISILCIVLYPKRGELMPAPGMIDRTHGSAETQA